MLVEVISRYGGFMADFIAGYDYVGAGDN